MSEFVLLYVPVGNRENGKQIAHFLIEQRLAVCVNILPGLTSLYSWQGNVEESSEELLLIKTPKANLEHTKKAIKELHKYETPCIAEIEINALNPEYENWARSVTKT